MEQKIQFKEGLEPGYKSRTLGNAAVADVTIAFAINFYSPGEILTKKAALEHSEYLPINMNVNSLYVDPVDVKKVVTILNENPAIAVINIAGNSIHAFNKKYTQQEVDDFVYEFLKQVVEHPDKDWGWLRIYSGGQTGADEAGAKAGIKLGLETIIQAPKGWMFRDINGQDILSEEEFKSRFQ